MSKNFLFYSCNNLNEDTLFVSSGTSTASRMYDNDTSTVWGAADTAATLSFSFDPYFPETGRLTATTLIFVGINWQSFTISDGLTTSANIVDGPTTSANFISNSASTLFLIMPYANTSPSWSITVNSTFDNSVASCAEWYVLSEITELERNPKFGDYKPVIMRQSYEHEMQDGGTIIYELENKFQASIKIGNISETQQSELLEVYDYTGEFYFIPDGTTTSWGGKIYKCNWIGDFNFYNYAENIKDNGFTGSFRIQEASN